MVARSEPSVTLSFANNFWGKEDAGVGPMLQRMHDAKTTCDELKGFYAARATIEDEFARKLLALSKKPLGSAEGGSLKSSMDVIRLEVESMAKAHQNIANQMKTELEEPLAAFSGAMRERRRIIQGGCEKILKLKMQQTQQVNKTKDAYERDCLKIKGYLAQGHMVMGQEERKNKARLEKAQVALTTSNAEYENAIKALEKTTDRWNRQWKEACDGFQDLEEERIDFLKQSCWTFANISSTVCVSDDASCEKIRLSLEDIEVEKDITSFIVDKGTGQEIPDAPKYINFVRGDYSDDGASEAAEENYKLAQFPRAGNPAYRSASPNPSTCSSQSSKPSADPAPEQPSSGRDRGRREKDRDRRDISNRDPTGGAASTRSKRHQSTPPTKHQRTASVPHNEYPLDVQTPGSNGSEYSNPTSESTTTSTSSSEVSQAAQAIVPTPAEEEKQMKRRSGFFSGAPFRRKSKSEKDHRQRQIVLQQQQQQQQMLEQQQRLQQRRQQQQQQQMQQQQQQQLELQEQRRLEAQRQREPSATTPGSLNNRKTWSPSTAPNNIANSPTAAGFGSTGRQRQSQFTASNDRYASPEPIEPNASLALNVGGNVFDVSTPQDAQPKLAQKPQEEEDLDPVAQALAELKGVTKNSVGRNSADRYFGLATPAPSATPAPNSAVAAAQRGTPPPGYIPKPTSALGVPPPAFDSAQMQQTTQRYVNQRNNLLEGPPQMPAVASEMQGRPRSRTMGYDRPQSQHSSRDMVVAGDGSGSPARSVSPRPQLYGDEAYRNNSPKPQNPYSRATSPNPYTQSRPGTANSSKPSPYAAYNQGSPGPGQEVALSKYRTASPALSNHSRGESYNFRSRSRAGSTRDGYGSGSNRNSYYGDQGAVQMYQGGAEVARPRSKSTVGNNVSRDGRPIINYARAMYQYTAAIPTEMSFTKGDILAILAHQEDGWWDAELVGVTGCSGLVPSNYLQLC